MLYNPFPDAVGEVMYANLGYYIVGDKFFYSNVDAFIESNASGNKAYHTFYDDVFHAAHEKGLWKATTLPTLYVQRAIQLRQMYDVVAVNFSGGWDSRNILDSFEAAGCQVDFIVIQSIETLIDRGIVGDRNPGNWITEISHAALPYAKEFCARNPKTKLIVLDRWFDKVVDDFSSSQDNLSDIFKQTLAKPGIMYSRNSEIQYDPDMQRALEGGKTACLLQGIDKPIITHSNFRSATGFFPEAMLSRFKIPRKSAGYTANIIHDSFYWTPYLPELAIRGWYELYKLTLKDKIVAMALNAMYPPHVRANVLLSHYVQEEIKRMLYPKFDSEVWTVNKLRDWGFLFTLEAPLISMLDEVSSRWRDKLLELFNGLASVVGAHNVVTQNDMPYVKDESIHALIGDEKFFFKYRAVPGMIHKLDMAYIKNELVI